MWSSLTAGAEYAKKAVAEASVAASEAAGHAAAAAQQVAEQGAAAAQQAATTAAEEASKAAGMASSTAVATVERLSSMHTPEGSALLHRTVHEFLALTGEKAADAATPADLVPLMRERALRLIKAAESYREQANAMAERGKEYKAQFQEARDRLEMVGRAGKKMQARLAEQTACSEVLQARVAQLEQLVASAGLALPPAPAAPALAAPATGAAELQAEVGAAVKPAGITEALTLSIEPSGSSLVLAIRRR